MSKPTREVLAWHYQREIEPYINQFLDDYHQNTLLLGEFDLINEPWRLMAILNFRKFQLKIIERKFVRNGKELTEIKLCKNKLTNLKP